MSYLVSQIKNIVNDSVKDALGKNYTPTQVSPRGEAGTSGFLCVSDSDRRVLLMDGVADGDGEFGLAVPEYVVVQDSAHGDYRRLVVGHFDSDGVGQGDDADTPCVVLIMLLRSTL